MKIKPRLLAILLVILLVLPSYSTPALGEERYENPSREETGRKIETIARSKGIPSVILKVIAYVESGWRQFDSNGNVVINASGARPALGIMQIASYDESDTELVNKLKYDIDFNISYGANLLNTKWDMTPRIGDGDKNKLENWYFALWAYNNWSTKNNPNNAAALGKVAYQDAVIKRAAVEYFSGGVVTPVQITPVSPELIPPDTIPDRSQTWDTPEPYTLGDLNIGTGSEPNRGTTLGKTIRIAGQDRIDNVNQIALAGWSSGAKTVIITRDDDFPDALAGVPLAKQYDAPILLTNPKVLDAKVIDTLNTLQPSKAIILGGEGAVSAEVEKKIREVLHWTEDIRRIAGANRFETAALIAKEFPRESKVALATGMNFPDALSLASAAASNGIPLLLVAPQEVPQATKAMLQELAPSGLYVAGGEAVVSEKVVEEIAQTNGIPRDSIARFAGENRYETSVKIAEKFYPSSGEIYFATGQDFADPLAAGALAAAKNACLLLISPQGFTLNGPTEKYLKGMPYSTNGVIVGRESSITETTENQIKYLLKQI